MTRRIRAIVASILGVASVCHTAARADDVKVAVAANFTAAMKQIATGFEQTTGHRALLSFGSTGKLYAQIVNGAPFALFLAADQARPRRLVTEGKAHSPFTYATGKLVLWSARPDYVDGDGKVLAERTFKRLAIANPKTAPYGAAAIQVLDGLGLSAVVRRRLVQGDTIAQTHQFVATGNADLGFVALAQVVLNPEGSRWDVPQNLYAPIRQDAVLLDAGSNQPAALALFEYLKGAEARAVIERFGYGLE